MIEYLTSKSGELSVKQRGSMTSSSWTRCEKPSDGELSRVIGWGLDADIVSDALDPHEVPRVDQEDDHTYFITRVPDVGDAFNSFTTPIMFVLGFSSIITVSRDSLGRLWQPFIDKTQVASNNQNQLFLLMVDMIVRQYDSRVAAINRQMRALTSDVIGIHSRDIATFTEYERKLNDYLDALIPMNVAVEKLLGGRILRLGEDDADLVEDLSIDLEQVISRCKSLLRTMTNVRDSYRAVMDTRLNETMRILTVATLALTIPTMLAGLFGMNVDLPGMENKYMFWIIAGVSVGVSSAVVYYFIKKR